MSIWKREFTLDDLNRNSQGSAVSQLGITFSQVGEDFLEAQMPVDERTMQPWGILHGGISAALAETVGSAAGYLCTEGEQLVVGSEINASHLRPVPKGAIVTARATAAKIGRTLQVWQINISDQEGKLCCTARLTNTVIQPHE